jgi:hypothetical protein
MENQKTKKEKEKNKEKERKAEGNDSAQLRIQPTAHPGSNRSGTLAPPSPTDRPGPHVITLLAPDSSSRTLSSLAV